MRDAESLLFGRRIASVTISDSEAGTDDAGVTAMRLAVPADPGALYSVGHRAFSDFAGHWHTDKRLPQMLSTRLYA